MRDSTKEYQLEASTESILESISDGVFTVDLNWRVAFFNRAAEKITGISRQKAVGKYCSEVFRSSMCEKECALRKTMNSGKPIINKSCFFLDAEGNRKPISISTALLRNSKGEIIGGAETFRDLTELDYLRRELKGKYKIGDIISHSKFMKPIFDLLPALSSSSSTILIQGESGTGKELLARAIHGMSERSTKPFVAVNCAALPDSLLESELFGYKKGAFTGANRDKPGRFAIAEDGTLFLDEIADISPALQVKLLRVLQDQIYEPLGSVRSEKNRARIIVATNKNLSELVEKGKFRLDLFYRINIFTLEIPPLRDRKEDIPLLLDHFIEKFNHLQNKNIKGFSPEVYSLLMAHDWPGNVRELENAVEHAYVLCQQDIIQPKHLPTKFQAKLPTNFECADLKSTKLLAERQAIIAALKNSNYNRKAASEKLGINKATLFRKLKTHNLDLPDIDGRSNPAK